MAKKKNASEYEWLVNNVLAAQADAIGKTFRELRHWQAVAAALDTLMSTDPKYSDLGSDLEAARKRVVEALQKQEQEKSRG